MKFNTHAASVLVFAGFVVISHPALSQGAMGPGGASPAPLPRVVAPTPQAPQAPRAPALVPTPPTVAPMGGAPQAKSGPTAGGSGKDAAKIVGGGLNGDIVIDDPTGDLPNALDAGGGQQKRSKAPLPAGYGYDATGRIVYTGR